MAEGTASARDEVVRESARGSKARQLRLENHWLKNTIDNLQKTIEDLQQIAYQDPLTDIGNRRFFERRMAEEVSRTQRYPGKGLALMIIDVNDFKMINDTHGHEVGDATLRWLARLLESSLRQHDVCCRLAGDEFAIIMPETSATAAALVAQRLLRRLELENADRRIPVSISLGSACWPYDGKHAKDLFAAADAAMYRNKRSHKNTVKMAMDFLDEATLQL